VLLAHCLYHQVSVCEVLTVEVLRLSSFSTRGAASRNETAVLPSLDIAQDGFLLKEGLALLIHGLLKVSLGLLKACAE
jgi:hypothetical protein